LSLHRDTTAVYVACRVIDLPNPYVPSQIKSCERCRLQVWIDPMSLARAILAQGREPLVLCSDCSTKVGLV
jgi:hypothetical protein